MKKNTPLIIVAIIAALVCLVLTGVYWTHPADQLPHWLPGYNAGDTKVHLKHGLGALILAVGAGILAWFQTGPNSDSTPPPSANK